MMEVKIEIDDVCHDHHLKLLSEKMIQWELIATDLGLSQSDSEGIKRDNSRYKVQKYEMLRTWKEISGKNATYKTLADVFRNNEEAELAEELNKIIKIPVPLELVSVALKNYLKRRYKQGITFEQWPILTPEIYINLALVKQQNVKLNKIDDNYTRSTIHYCLDDVFKEKEPINLEDIFEFKKNERKCILIEAGPGLGKTTLSFKICKDWANGVLLQDYDAVVLLQLRFPKIQKAKEIVDLLSVIEDDDLKQKVWKEICNNDGDRVCFIAEGFDELPQDLQRDSIFIHILDKLPCAMVIYTSRPVAVSQLMQRLISKRIEIIGFKSEQVQQYVEATLTEQVTEFLRIIKSNTFVERLIHIPVYLAIVTYLVSINKSLPSTRTEIYWLLVEHIILRYLIEKKCDGPKYLESFENIPEEEGKHFFNMCYLAFQGLECSKIIFNTRDLRTYRIPENINGLGLLHVTPTLSDHGMIESLNFMHLHFQEFCAAYYASKFSQHWQHKIFMKHQDDSNFQIFWQFFAGLTKLKCRQIFTSMIPASNVYSSLCKYDLIQLLLCLYEAGSPDLCKQAITFMNGNIDLSGYDLDLLSCSSISHFIKNYIPGSIKALKLKWCGIGDEGLAYICESLIDNYKPSSYVINMLNLDISYNDLTESSAHHIAKLLSSPCLIRSLCCTGNFKLGDSGIEIIANSLLKNYVKSLGLRRTGLALKGIQALGKVLCSDTNLETLDISDNDLDCKMLSCLSDPLVHNHTLTTLLVKWCKLGADEAKVFSSILKSNNTIINLDLGYNKLGSDGIVSIIEAFRENQTLQSLNLNVNEVTSDDNACYISELIVENLQHLLHLHIGGNFEEQGLEAISEAAKNIQSLTTLDLTPRSMSVTAKPLNFLGSVISTNIKSLHIVPPLDSSVFSAALASNDTLEELKISSKVSHGFATLTQGIVKNKKITKVEFLFTKLEKQWLKDISNMLQVKTNITSLAISGEVYPEDCKLLCNGLLKCTSLQNLSFTSYQRIDPPIALEFLSSLETLDSLANISLGIDSQQKDSSKISNQEFNGTEQLRCIPQQNIPIFRKIERLILSINERRHSNGSPELLVFIQEK